MKIDEKDRTIISMYALNPNVSQEDIAHQIGLSQPSVAVRIRKLKERGAIETQTGINPLKMGLYVAKVDVTTNNSIPIMEMFRGCPYFANGFTVSGKYNLCLFFISENISALEALVNNHLRSHEYVTDLAFNIIISSEKDFIVPTVLQSGESVDPPCGDHVNCQNCPSFAGERCSGCPAIFGRGWLG